MTSAQAAAWNPVQRRAGPQDAGKWSNWQAAVEVGRSGLHREADCRSKRHQSFEDRAAAPAVPPAGGTVVNRFAVAENESARAMFERYGKWSTGNFDPLKMLGEGAFGVVHLVKRKSTEELYALKQMRKARFQQKNRQRAFTERDALAEARSRWCVELFATFQDAEHVYMVMEFIQGGDLIGHLQRKGRFSEEETTFYMGELLEALDTVHRCGFVHRDVKPDNVVICLSGHLKLLDFGLCKDGQQLMAAQEQSPQVPPSIGVPASTAAGGRAGGVRGRLHSIVGTPQYMAPEGFSGEYGPEADLWAVGIITFECLAGVVPFHSGRREGPEAIRMIKEKIVHHAEVLPERLRKTRRFGWTTEASERFLQGVICDRARRLTAEEIRREPFFAQVDFSALHLATPPFVPQVAAPDDTSLFESFSRTASLPQPGPRMHWDKRMEWAHYDADGRALGKRASHCEALETLLDREEDENNEVFQI